MPGPALRARTVVLGRTGRGGMHLAMKVSIAMRLIALAVVLTVVPMGAISYLAVQQMTDLGDYALDSTTDLGDTATDDSTSALESLGQDMIQQKAEDVAKQVEIYIKSHPTMNVSQLQQDAVFSELAVQPVGETGYTALTDVATLTCRFHSSPSIANLDLHALATSLRGFWEIMSKSEGGVPSAGYYDWEDPDGSIRPKYMYIAIVNATTADSVTFSVAATTYIDEFSSPITQTTEKIAAATAQTHDQIDSRTTQLFNQLTMIIIILVVIVVICAIAFTRSITTPVSKLKEMANKINKGDLDAKVTIDSSDEIGDLGRSFDAMRLSLKRSYETLEDKVVDRTKELDKAKAYAESIIRNMADTLIVVDRKGRIERVNQATIDLLGYTNRSAEKELIGKPVDVIIFPIGDWNGTGGAKGATDEGISGLFGRFGLGDLLKRGSVKDAEVYYVKKDGNKIPMSLNGSVMRNKKGNTRGVVCVANDITERQRLEEERYQAKVAAEEAARTKSEFLANMSHEIRTPLNGVMGMIDLTLDLDLNDEQREYLRLAKSSADSLMTIINDILDFSKIEAKRLDLDKVDFDLVKTIEETLSIHSVEATRKGLELMLEIEPSLRSALIGDPVRLKQIITNLVRNSIKFTDKGHIIVKAEGVESHKEGLAKVHFSVKDTGIGISKEQQAMVFDMFTQLDASSTKRQQGTGLGLTISKGLVDMMGGDIWLESKLGEGSTFHFTALFGVQKNSKSISDMGEVDLKGWNVLVVDDNEINRMILRRTLESWGTVVTEAHDGDKCLSILDDAAKEQEGFKLLLIDCWMPKMDGIELVRRIRERGGLKDHIIMMLSSVEEKGVRDRCNEWGIPYLLKPVRPSDLMDSIMKVASRTKRIEDATKAKGALSERLRSEMPAGLKVLIAEDNEINLTLVNRLLEKVGVKPALAGNGLEVLKATDGKAFDLILMDVQMPEMDGVDATRKIREQEERTGGHVHIIALTAHAMKGDMERFLAAGMDDYLSKPLKSQLLYEKLLEFLEARKKGK